MLFSFTAVSKNKKTGPMATIMSAMSTCPSYCELAKACYAKQHFTGIHFRKLSSKGLDFDDLISKIKTIAKRAVWRYGVAGDLPGENDVIDVPKVEALIKANRGRRGFAYTHYDPADNMAILAKANRAGFTINLSANNLDQAEDYHESGLPVVVVVLPEDTPNVSRTSSGVKVVVCPNQQNKKVTCHRCEMCADSDRDYIVGFRAHGTRKKAAENVFFAGHKLVGIK